MGSLVTLVTPPKPHGRTHAERPYAREQERSLQVRLRAPETLRELLHEFREAVDAETPMRLHAQGVESEQGLTANAIAIAIVSGAPLPKAPDSGGSYLGDPRWTAQFRAYVDAGGSPFATYVDDHGEEQWAYPLRSSLVRMQLSRSGTDRVGADFAFLLRRCRIDPRAAWMVQVGKLTGSMTGERDGLYIADVAEAWAHEALRRWYRYYVERPIGRRLA